MSSFAPVATQGVAPPDPTKHVSYTSGMILGVADFIQEYTYLSARDQWMLRELIGYGTACGLDVRIEDAGQQGPRIAVT